MKRKAGNARFHALSQVDQYAALIKTFSVFRQFFHMCPSLIYFIKFFCLKRHISAQNLIVPVRIISVIVYPASRVYIFGVWAAERKVLLRTPLALHSHCENVASARRVYIVLLIETTLQLDLLVRLGKLACLFKSNQRLLNDSGAPRTREASHT